MKTYILFFFLVACASSNSDWDNGANRRNATFEHQREEQVDNTNMQMTTPGRAGASQNQPF